MEQPDMFTEEKLEAAVKKAEKQLEEAQKALNAFRTTPEYHTYDTLDEALGAMEDLLYGQARADCEGSYNCGDEEYTQDFIVDGIVYTARMTFEYNRHDKTYYYIEESTFEHFPKVNA